MKNSYLLLVLSLCLFFGCTKNPSDNSLNLFSIEDDVSLGAEVAASIDADPAQYPVLSASQYPEAYAYVTKMRDKILNSGQVFYKDKFTWEVKIIKDDNTLNAFCTPGGHIYIYTGLIKYLDSEDQLAGVLGHEMAHADRRHSTDALTRQYGISFLLQYLLGKNPGQLADITASITSLQFSKASEKEADEYSVVYLCPTDYNAAGAAGFFSKLLADGQSGGSDFFSTHPSPDKRVENINSNKATKNCSGSATYSQEYAAFKTKLP